MQRAGCLRSVKILGNNTIYDLMMFYDVIECLAAKTSLQNNLYIKLIFQNYDQKFCSQRKYNLYEYVYYETQIQHV